MLALFKDPANRLSLLVPVLMQTLLFGYAATFDLTDIPYVVAGATEGASARSFIEHLNGTGIFHCIASVPNESGIIPYINERKAVLAIHFAPNFEREINTGKQAPVQVILDGRNSTTSGIALNYLNTIAITFNSLRGMSMPIELQTRSWFNPTLETRWNILPALLASLILIQIMILAGLSVAREREQGTFDQMLVTPLSPTEILIGKAIPPILVGMIQTCIMLLISLYWFKIPLVGGVMPLAIVLFVFTLSVVSTGLCISALAKNMQQGVIFSFVLLLPMVLLSGLATPIKAMPEVMQIATWANPLRFAIESVRRIYLEGCGLSDIAVNFIPMLVVAAITLPLAAWLFRNRLT